MAVVGVDAEVARVGPTLRTTLASARRGDLRWYLVSGAVLIGAIVLGASIGPAGPDWWRVPLALLDRLPLISIDSGAVSYTHLTLPTITE